MRIPWRKTIRKFGIIAGWALVCGAIAYLAHMGMFSRSVYRFTPEAWARLVLCGILFAVVTCGLAVRFCLVLAAMGGAPAWTGQVRIYFAGLLLQAFGSNFAFDAMRGLLMKKSGMGGGLIVGSILADRILGLTAFLFFGFAGLGFLFDPERYAPVLAVSALAAVLLPGMIVLWWKVIASGRFPRLSSLPGASLAASVGEALHCLVRRPLRLFAIQTVAVAVNFLMLVCYYVAAGAIATVELSLTECVVGGAIANLVSLLPLPVTGLGVGESVFGNVVAGLRNEAVVGGFASVFFLVRIVVIVVSILSWLAVSVTGMPAAGEESEADSEHCEE